MIAPRPVVEHTVRGAISLGVTYWPEVERLTRGLVRARIRGSGMELRITGREPTLLRIGPPQLTSTYPTAGGLLARRAAGFAAVG